MSSQKCSNLTHSLKGVEPPPKSIRCQLSAGDHGLSMSPRSIFAIVFFLVAGSCCFSRMLFWLCFLFCSCSSEYLAEAKTTRNTSQTFPKHTINTHKSTLNLPETSRSNPLNLPETKPPCRWIRVPGFGDRIPGGHLQLDLWSSPFLCLLEWTLCRV